MDEIFDKESLSKFLKVELKTVEHLANIKRLPYFRVGRHIRFRRSAIEEWAKINEVCPEKF
ncbi:helix-turn-helix domain-containing protein [Candidatus Margulisiibacteriota bacterium]